MTRTILLSIALAVGLAASAASADSSQDETRRAFLKNRQIKWQRVQVDAPHALVGPAKEAKASDAREFRVAPRMRTGFRR